MVRDMTIDPSEWRSPATDDLIDTIVALPDRAAAERFFRDLCTFRELHDLAQRWHVVRLLDAGLPYAAISREAGASTATITRIAQWLHHGTGGYREALARAARPADEGPADEGAPVSDPGASA
jgi:TrpR-related protein YerC/YecD